MRIALLCALGALLAAPLGAEEGEPGGPILLTNEDVERITGSKSTAAEAQSDRAAPQARSSAPADPDRIADSWQEEYYRLKAQALQRALDRGERIESVEPAAEAPGTPPAKPDLGSSYSSEPTCLYGRRGKLILGPRGVDCPQHRQLDASRRTPTAGSREHGS